MTKPEPFPEAFYPGDEMVELEDGSGRMMPLKKTICIPHGNALVERGKRIKMTGALRKQQDEDETLLRQAAENGYKLNVKELLKKGVNVNCRAQAAGATPLICASHGGHLEVMKMLYEAGADPHLANGGWDTPLSVAAKWNQFDVCKWLLQDCKVDPRQFNNSPSKETPLHHARYLGNKDLEELIASYWVKFQEKDDERAKKKAQLEETRMKQHRAKVSREAQERREAAGA